MTRNHKTTWLAVLPGVLLAIAVASIVSASPVNVPNTFTPGTPAVAAEVNANFAAVEAAVNDNDSRITSNTNELAAIRNFGALQAAAAIDANGNVQRFFNSRGGTPTVNANGTGVYRVLFPGFTDMNQRFYSVTVGGTTSGAPAGFGTATPFNISLEDSVYILTFDDAGAASDEEFYILIF